MKFESYQLTFCTNLFNTYLVHHQILVWDLHGEFPAVEDAIKILQNNNNSFGFSGLNQIILKTKNRFVEELKRCCSVENEFLCPSDRGKHLSPGCARVFSQNPERAWWITTLQTDVRESPNRRSRPYQKPETWNRLCLFYCMKCADMKRSFLCRDMTIHNLDSSFNYTYLCYVIEIRGWKISEWNLNYLRQNFCFYLMLDRARSEQDTRRK